MACPPADTAANATSTPPPSQADDHLAPATSLSEPDSNPPDYNVPPDQSTSQVPEYTAPLPTELHLLEKVHMTHKSPPNFFSPLRPERIEDKIPNTEYGERMRSLNQEILKSRSVRRTATHAWVLYSGMLLADSALVVALILKLIHFSAVGLILPIAVIFLWFMPRRPQYIDTVAEFAEKWTKEDELTGINLIYQVRYERTFNAGLFISCTLEFYEQLTFDGHSGRPIAVLDLPLYEASPQAPNHESHQQA
ncbi:hypothetical protein HDU78_006771 [Chytriomyces hyalinus]|nr:hypothetical protein HDU78_006771 [Chytriomyces hyalinus]